MRTARLANRFCGFFLTSQLYIQLQKCIKQTNSVTFSPANELYRLNRRHFSAKLVSAFAVRQVSRGQYNGSPRQLIWVYRPEPQRFHSSNSSVIPTRLSGPRSKTITSQKMLAAEIEPGPSKSVAPNH
jgi:hypothetical protein